MMSQAYTHAWDEIEYFELAVPHAEKEPKVAGVKAGCNGCHAPLAFLPGDVPPPKPSAKSRANESVSCDLCHTITGFEGDVPYNFNWVVAPGRVKQGPRAGLESPHHATRENPFLRSAEFCGTCHNEMDAWGLYVKSTHLEWKEGPHGKAGIVCQDCHMPPAAGRSARMGDLLSIPYRHRDQEIRGRKRRGVLKAAGVAAGFAVSLVASVVGTKGFGATIRYIKELAGL